MPEYHVGTISKEYFQDRGYRGFASPKLQNLKISAGNFRWTSTAPDIGPRGFQQNTTSRGAVTRAVFSKGQKSRQSNLRNNITASSVFPPTVRVYLRDGLVIGLNKTMHLEFQKNIQGTFGPGVPIDPSKGYSELSLPLQQRQTSQATESSRDVMPPGRDMVTANVSSYQEAYSGRFTCQVVLQGIVVFDDQQQYISEIMRGRNGVQVSGDSAFWTMEGEVELRKNSKPTINWS